VWSNNNSDPLSAYLNMAPADFSRTFDQYLTGKLRAERVSVDGSTSTTIMRMGDDANGPRLLVQAQKPDGTHALIELTGKDLKEIQRRNATYQQLGQHGSSATARDDIGMDGFVTQPLL
jgi:hypothetical protein